MKSRDDAKIVEKVNRLFHDLTASSYGNMHPEIFQIQHRRLIEFLKKHFKSHFSTVLDVGSGDGFMLSVIKASGFPTFDRFIMLDISLQMLKIAKKRHQEALFVNASSSRLPFKNNSIDLITVNSVLHHLPDPTEFFIEARRVLKKGGVIFINHEPNIRFSKNGVLWYLSLVVSRFYRNINLIKTLKRILASIRGIKNPVYKEINKILLDEGLIKEPLPDAVISSYIDYHSPTAGKLRRGVGINPEMFRKYFEVKYIETYAHLGKIGEKHDGGITNFIESLLKKRYPLDGSKLTAILVNK